MRRIRRFLSRLSIRILAFNLLLVFLPVAGVLYLGTYESELLAAQRRALDEEARLGAAAISASNDPAGAGRAMVRALAAEDSPTPSVNDQRADPIRLRLLAADGSVLADTHPPSRRRLPRVASEARHNFLYRAGAAALKPLLRLLRLPEPALTESDYYERSDRLQGDEVRAALVGKSGHAERISPDRRSVTVYAARPVLSRGRVAGAVLASQSTYTILQDLYVVRLGIVRIFVGSVVMAMILSFLVATTIVRPLRQLRKDAGLAVDRRGRLRGRFRGSKKSDEIGDLSRALERLTRRLDGHVRFIESFAADVSHEFKNPLTSIRTATEMLAEVEQPQERARFLRMVESEVARMESLLSGVREITLIDARLSSEQRQRVDLAALLGRIVDDFRLRENATVELLLQVPDSVANVEGVEDRLIQVFINVLENGISFSPQGGVVTITLQRIDRLWSTTIDDQGRGIAEGDVARVFDRFFTHRPENARRGWHTGLGLAIVKAIVEGYGGTIAAMNLPEQGARFEIRLPAAPG
jgi:two-component system sensor histidine kinase ChvG